MGIFKKISKAVSKTIKKAVSPAAGLLGGAPKVDMPDAPGPAAVEVEAPKEDVQTDDTVETSSDKKKTRSAGKKSLSVARSSGAGVNI